MSEGGPAGAEDAEQCIATKPDWAKGYNRKAGALPLPRLHMARASEALDSLHTGPLIHLQLGAPFFTIQLLWGGSSKSLGA